MIEGFYFHFFRITKSKTLSIILAYTARFFFFIKFLILRAFLVPEYATMTEEQALSILEDTSSQPSTKPDYSNCESDPAMDLSVIVPVYNHMDVLPECINSILNQNTEYRYEVLLIDDGSTDGAEKYIERYAIDHRVKIIHQDNGGIAAARNTGIANASGRYLMFVDCDDTVHDNIVDLLVKTAEEKHCDIVMAAHNLVKVADGKILSVLPNIYPQKNLLGYKNGDEIMNYAGLPWAKVYRREMFRNVRFFPGYWYEDTIIQALLFTQCKSFTYIPEIVYEYSWHESNFSHVQESKQHARPKSIDRFWILKAITEQYDSLALPHDAKFYTMLLKHVSGYTYSTIATLSNDVNEAVFIADRALLQKYKPKQNVKLPLMLSLTEKAILKNNIALWKLCSLYQ